MNLSNFITKKVAFYSSIGMIALFFVADYTIPLLCGRYSYSCQDKFEVLFPILLIFFPILLFTLITYFLNEETFHSWRNFSFIWVLVTTVLILFTPEMRGLFFDVGKEDVSLFLAALFTLISPFVIIYSTVKYKYQKKNKSFKISRPLIILFSFIIFIPIFWFFRGLFFSF